MPRTSSKRPVQPEDLLKFVFVGDPQMSPDGSRVLFTRKHVGDKNRYVTNLWIVGASGEAPAHLTQGGQDGHGRWSTDGSRIAFIRGDRDRGTSQVFLIDVNGGEARALTTFPEGSIGAFKWSPDGRSIALTFRPTADDRTKRAEEERKATGASVPPRITEDLWYRLDGDGYFMSQRYAVHVVDAKTGAARRLFDRDDLGNYTFDWSPDSKRLAITANSTRNSLVKPWNDDIFLVDASSGRAVKVPNLPSGPKSHVTFSPDGSRLAYAGREGDDGAYSTENLGLFVCDAKRGGATDVLARTDYCLLAATLSDAAEALFAPAIAWNPDGRRLFARVGWHGEGRIISVPSRGGKTTTHLRGRVDYALGTFDRSGRALSLVRGGPTTLPEIAVARVGSTSSKARVVTSLNRQLLSELDIAEPSPHWIKSADGTRVHVWVMRPRRARRGGVPAVLEIHGGPHGQYGEQFFHEFQVLASAGYAVFYSNPRGSKGYGRDHCAAIRGAWGTADWTDIQAVIKFMKSRSWVDSRRLGVMGGSYGGYMTNWVIGHTREFAGAITDRCVSNLVSMWGSSDFPERPDHYWKGNAWDRPEASWASSPLRHLGNARTPTLIIHSEGDLRCNVEQGEQVFNVLRTHNVPARFVRYPSTTSHGMSRSGPPDLRLHRLHEILTWWKKYLR